MEAFLGSITLVGFNFAMKNYTLCHGQIMAISGNQALFALLGTSYGGDGRTSYAIPDLRGRVPTGTGRHPGSNIDWRVGLSQGLESITLTNNQMPAHTHVATFTGTGGGASEPIKVGVEVNVEVNIPVSIQDGQSEVPTTDCFLAKAIPGPSGADQPEKIYRSARDGLGDNPVSLGGVETTSTATATVTGCGGGITGGTVENAKTGTGNPFGLLQPTLGVNYEMCLNGLFPSRN